MANNQVLQVQSLVKEFKNVLAVDHISFNVEEGDIFAFLGPNGAGKTTTLRIILDIIRADQGTIEWRLPGMNGNTPAAASIGYLPEERGLYTDIPIIRSLIYLASIRGMEPAKAKTSAMEWLERMELADRAKDKLQTLSKGNQQRVQFIASILHKPAFAILDEPFSGLDPLNQEKFIDFMKEINRGGTTILLSAHQMPLVEKVANKIFLIHQGKEIFNGSLSDIYKQHGQQNILEISYSSSVPMAQLKSMEEAMEIEIINEQQARIILKAGIEINRSLAALSKMEGITQIRSFSSSLHDIFLNLVKNNNNEIL
ncbi:MAG: ATP-binding cassette domain-containing protein [Bacteroidales bacterium]|nr:ATP-binding cassette domain-containing protein [Bacteroidales bacterium]